MSNLTRIQEWVKLGKNWQSIMNEAFRKYFEQVFSIWPPALDLIFLVLRNQKRKEDSFKQLKSKSKEMDKGTANAT